MSGAAGLRKKAVEKALECVNTCVSKNKRKLASCFVECYVGSAIREAYEWIDRLKYVEEKVVKLYGASAVTYSRELKSFLDDPRRHLEKKLFIYTHDFIRGRISAEEYARKSLMAVNTSLRTNLRTIYQDWGFLALLLKVYREGTRIIYPEHRIISLERSGRQKLRWIPPNLVIDIPGYGSTSLFMEVPRPLAWGDTGDLSRIWSLYTALRPDMMVYGGRVYDVLDLESNPPIKKPDIIIEFKELPDWYVRKRIVKGPLAEPLSAEEWRNRWIEGLYTGLADVLGVSREEAIDKLSRKTGVLMDEVRVVELYRSIYRPAKMFLVSKHPVPGEVRNMLEAHDITVVDDVGFNTEKLEPVAKSVLESCVQVEEYVISTRDRELAEMLALVKELWEKGVLDKEKIRRLLIFGLSEEISGSNELEKSRH